jgi:hypothetical protein
VKLKIKHSFLIVYNLFLITALIHMQSVTSYSLAFLATLGGVVSTITPSLSNYYCDLSDYAGTGIDATEAIQSCIDIDASSVILSPGLYTVSKGLTITHPVKIMSSNISLPCSLTDASACPIIQASPEFHSTVGVLSTGNQVGGVWLDHIVIDGNRAYRQESLAAEECANQTNNRDGGRNIFFNNCDDCLFTNSISANALCASGFVWVGANGILQNNQITNNGDHIAQMMWADGITCLSCDGASITGNAFSGNTDIDLILGSGVGSIVSNNSFSHDGIDLSRGVFGALMFDNFNGGTTGNFDSCIVSDNTVACNADADMCCFGIQLGPHPWYPSDPVAGNCFNVTGNSVSGAGVGINADAAGNDIYPVTVMNNVVTDTRKSFECGALCSKSRGGSAFNYSPDSRVEFHNNAPTSTTSYKC